MRDRRLKEKLLKSTSNTLEVITVKAQIDGAIRPTCDKRVHAGPARVTTSERKHCYLSHLSPCICVCGASKATFVAAVPGLDESNILRAIEAGQREDFSL